FCGRCGRFFFFQAEDGIRDRTVTGVQTCALPIFIRAATPDTQGWRTATIWIENVQHAAGMLLGFDSDIEVLSPAALRRELPTREIGRASCRERVETWWVAGSWYE